MRRILLSFLAAAVVLGGLAFAAVATNSGSTVTRARLEHALPQAFAQVYAQQARLLGHEGVTPASLHPRAMCDKHGPNVADVGPGGDWICLMSWEDPNVPMPPEGYGKFELNVHSNDCYTAAGPTKLTGYLTLTDTDGHEVTNPAFEFDGCFDPNGDNTPTDNNFPSTINITSTVVAPTADHKATIQLGCGTGADGCTGTVMAAAGDLPLGEVPFTMKEESTATIKFPAPLPTGAAEITFTVSAEHGVAQGKPTTLPVQPGPGR